MRIHRKEKNMKSIKDVDRNPAENIKETDDA